MRLIIEGGRVESESESESEGEKREKACWFGFLRARERCYVGNVI